LGIQEYLLEVVEEVEDTVVVMVVAVEVVDMVVINSNTLLERHTDV
jgi:hypothetical protein